MSLLRALTKLHQRALRPSVFLQKHHGACLHCIVYTSNIELPACCSVQLPKTPWQERQATRISAIFDEDEQESTEPRGTLGSAMTALRQKVRDAGGLLAYKYFNWRKVRFTRWTSV